MPGRTVGTDTGACVSGAQQMAGTFFFFILSVAGVPSGCRRRGHAALPGYKHNARHRSSGLLDVRGHLLALHGVKFGKRRRKGSNTQTKRKSPVTKKCCRCY